MVSPGIEAGKSVAEPGSGECDIVLTNILLFIPVIERVAFLVVVDTGNLRVGTHSHHDGHFPFRREDSWPPLGSPTTIFSTVVRTDPVRFAPIRESLVDIPAVEGVFVAVTPFPIEESHVKTFADRVETDPSIDQDEVRKAFDVHDVQRNFRNARQVVLERGEAEFLCELEFPIAEGLLFAERDWIN